MSTPALVQSLSFDLQSINDLAFDEGCEMFLQLGGSIYTRPSRTLINLSRPIGFSCGLHMVHE